VNAENIDISAAPSGFSERIRTPDLSRVVAAARHRLPIFLITAAIVFTAVMVFTFLKTPVYSASADVMINNQHRNISGLTQVTSEAPADSTAVDTEVEVLSSRSLASRVVTQLHLDRDPEFNPSLRTPTALGRVLGAPSEAFSWVVNTILPRPAKSKLATDLLAKKKFDGVVDNVIGHLTVDRVGLTYVIKATFSSEDPVKASRIADAFAQQYLLDQLETKFETTRQASNWLNQRLSQLRGQVEQAETQVARYRASNGLMSAVGSSLTEQEVSTLNQQLATAQADQAERAARLSTARSQLRGGSNGDNLAEALGSGVVQNLRAQRSTVSRKVADMQQRYGEKHPDVLRAARELADIDTQIQLEINRVISNLEAELQVSRQRTGSILSSLGRARGTLAGNNTATVRLNELERNAAAVRSLYEGFLTRFKETSSQGGTEESDARVVSYSRIPGSPSSPNTSLNLLLGAVLAAACGIAAAGAAHFIDSGLSTAEDVQRKLSLPSMDSVPLLSSTGDANSSESSPIDWVVEKPLSALAEALRNLRISLTHSRLDRTVRVVALTSALPAEGKTTTSICLGRVAAIGGTRTVIVDCDLRRQNVSAALDIVPVVGLLEVLTGQATLDQALLLDQASGAFILPLAPNRFLPKDMFATPEMERLITELRERFELVLLDTAPVLAVSDTRILGRLADAVLMLARWRKTPYRAVETALESLERAGAHVVGVSLTQVDLRKQSKSGYGDPGYYYQLYSKYYVE